MATTISEQISAELAEDIITGNIKPGEKLEEQAIAERFKVSRTPVRDAFKQLISTGLIESRPHRGVTVINLEIEQLSELFEALGEIEALCARLSAQRMSTVERMSLQNLHKRSLELLKSDDITSYSDLNEQIHFAIHEGSHNACLAGVARDLWRRLSPFRRSIFFRRANRMSVSSHEHDDLIDSILEGDMKRAQKSMSSHVGNSALNAISFLNESQTD
jgi:DNA-binding GntR family transcriptional regulator